MSTAAAHNNNDWCTIESDPGVFTELLETLGCTTVQVEELWSLDNDTLERLCTLSGNKVYGLIFLFKWNSEQHAEHGGGATTEAERAAQMEEELLENNNNNDDDDNHHNETMIPNLFFAHQVTTNACATQALLSVVLNAGLSPDELGSTLTEFQSFTASFPPQLKGMAISSSEDIKTAHNRFARPDAFLEFGRSNNKRRWNGRNASELEEAFHFVAYIPHPAPSSSSNDGTTTTVYELDGLQKAPLVAGTCGGVDDSKETPSESTTLDPWLLVARTAIQERMAKAESNHIKFNLLAVVQDTRIPLQEQLNQQQTSSSSSSELVAQLALEQAKRDQWKLENQRRRHNYVPLCVQMLRELARMGTLPTLIHEAKERKQQRSGSAKKNNSHFSK